MMLQRKLITTALFTTLVGVAGCTESEPETSTAPATLEVLAAQIGPQAKEFKIDARRGGPIRGDKISFTIPPRAIFDRSAQPYDVDVNGDGELDARLVTGSVMVSLRELNSVGDVVRAGRSTSTDTGAELESSGAFDLDIVGEGGRKLGVIKLAEVNFPKWADPNNDGPARMQQWMAPVAEKDAGWQQPRGQEQNNAQNTGPSYFFNSMPFGAIGNYSAANCDAITSLSAIRTTLKVKLPSNLVAQGGVFFLPANSNTAAKLYTKDLGLPGFVSYTMSMPVGITGKLVVVSLDAGNYYLYHDDTYTIPAGTPVPGGTEVNLTITPTLVTQAAFEAYMNGL